jgi:hypothetical protein
MLDFVGYRTGLPTAPPVIAGIRPLDFVGYPTGAPPVTVSAGFRGLLDFMGYSVGMTPFTPPPATGGGFDRNLPGTGDRRSRPKKRPAQDDEIWLLI